MKLFVLIISLLIAAVCSAQGSKLALYKNIDASFGGAETHVYTFESNGDQFGRLRLIQKGVDVKVIAISPLGQILQIFDTPNGKNGPEIITLAMDIKGEYRFEVKPFDKTRTSGAYSIKLEMVDRIAKSLEKKVDQIMSVYTKDKPGATIAVMEKGKILLSKGYGLSNMEYDIPNSPKTIYHIASISKQFTAFAILLLQEDGKLNVDDDIRNYIPEVPDFGKKITLRHLANHTSGIRDQWNLLAMAGWRMDDVISTEYVIKLVSRQKELNFEPGEEYLYSNTGFTLLAEVVARVSGKSFAEFTSERIFKPLKMRNSLFYDDHQKIVKNRAYSYSETQDGYKKLKLSYAIPGATSLFTTPEDLCKWSENFDEPIIGNEKTMKLLHTSGTLNNGDSIGYAFGQTIQSYKGLDYYGHNGADAGFRTFFTRYPDQGLTVAVFGNEATFNPSRIGNQIVDFKLKKEYAKFNAQQEEQVTTFNEEEVDVGMVDLLNYVGEYELSPGFIISVYLKGTDLMTKATGQDEFKVTGISDTSFVLKGFDIKISFPENLKTPSPHLTLYQSGRTHIAPRVQEFNLTEMSFEEFCGTYYSEELETNYEVVMSNNRLMVKHPRLSDFSLSMSKKDGFSSSYWAFSSVDFVRDEKSQVVGFKASNGRVRNVFFEKTDCP